MVPLPFSFSAPESIPPAVLWAVLAVALLAWAVSSSILWFHWRVYGSETKRIVRIKRVYLVGSCVLFALAMSFIFSL